MRRTPYLLLVVMTLMLSATIFYSCSRDETPEEKKEQEDKKVEDWESEDIDGDATMSSQVMRFSVGNIPSITRGITPFSGASYSFSVGDRITIELTRDDVVVGTKVYKVTNTDGDLEFDYDNYPTGQPFYLENKNDFQLRAWSYGNSTPFATNPVGNSFILNTDQRTNTTTDNYTELLYSPKQTYSYSTEKIPITLYHQMARLKVTLTHEASGDLSVDYVKIGNSSIPTTATFSELGIDIANDDFIGTWTGHGTANGQVYARADVANENYTAVLFPNTSLSGQLINVVTDNETKTYAYTLPSGVSFNPGNQYSYTITVKDKFFKTTAATATRNNLTVGDILCSDGTIYSNANGRYISIESKTPIGIVAYVAASDTDPIAENKRALVMALRNIGTGTSWGGYDTDEDNTLFPNNPYFTESESSAGIALARVDYKGLDKTNYLCQCETDRGHSHPAAKVAKNYSVSCSSITGSTGWFLPSLGQWCSVLVSMGGQTASEQKWRVTYDTDITAHTNINNFLSNIGAGNYDAILAGNLYWTSSEGNSQRATYIYTDIFGNGDSHGSHISHGTFKTSTNLAVVRAFMAF